MIAQVSVAQAKAEFASLVARAEEGENIVITRNGWPVACLGSLTARRPIRYGTDNLSLPKDVVSDFALAS